MNRQYTMLTDLAPDGYGESRGGSMLQAPPKPPENLQKFIRNNSYNPNENSGMALMRGNPQGGFPQGGFPQGNPQGGMPMGMPQGDIPKIMKRELSCLEVANHVNSCPICTKFYKVDTNLYLIIIAVLCIICLILMKKVLNV